MASLDDLTQDAQAEAAGCFVDTPDSWGGFFRAAASPVRLPGRARISPLGPAPQLGQHTCQVLAEAGYNDEAIAPFSRPARRRRRR